MSLSDGARFTPKLKRQSSSKNAVAALITSPRRVKSKDGQNRRLMLSSYVHKHVSGSRQMADLLRTVAAFDGSVYDWFKEEIHTWCLAHVTSWSRAVSDECTAISEDGCMYVMLDCDLGRACQRISSTGLQVGATLFVDDKLFFRVDCELLHRAFLEVCQAYGKDLKSMLRLDDYAINFNHSLKVQRVVTPGAPGAPALPPEPQSPRLREFAMTVLELTEEEMEGIEATRQICELPPPPLL